jgi:hypothetical protein
MGARKLSASKGVESILFLEYGTGTGKFDFGMGIIKTHGRYGMRVTY